MRESFNFTSSNMDSITKETHSPRERIVFVLMLNDFDCFHVKEITKFTKKHKGFLIILQKKVIHNFHFLLDMAREVLTLGKRFLHFFLDMAWGMLALGEKFIHFFLDNIRGIW